MRAFAIITVFSCLLGFAWPARCQESHSTIRLPWTSSRIVGSPEVPRPFKIEPVYPSLQYTNPVDVAVAPTLDRVFVLHLNGKFVSFDKGSDGSTGELLLDLRDEYPDQFQALGFTFHPDFRRNGFIYICYSRKPDKRQASRIARVSRFTVASLEPPRLDPDSELEYFTWEVQGHNGGCLKFGLDGYLYVSTGDGRPPSPPDALHTGQDISDLRSSILRIDVDDSGADGRYRIPIDNPFVKLPGARGEVWAYGFRNPWRMCFDPRDHALWLGDVGWEMWEMVHRVERGGNYGWSIREGSTQSIHPEDPLGPTPISPPVLEYPHTVGRSVTGGFVYRGNRFPELKYSYIYGDYVTGAIWGLWFEGGRIVRHEELADSRIQIISFAEDADGELLVVGYEGAIYQLERNIDREINDRFPRLLSETGLFESVPDQQPADGVMPYSIRQELWTDHVGVSRFIGLPGTSVIDVHRRQNVAFGERRGELKFPVDTVFARTVGIPVGRGNPERIRYLETQILHFDGEQWQPYNYAWNDDQTDASLVGADGFERIIEIRDLDAPGGIRRQSWRFAGRTECLNCHLIRTGSVQGFVDWQLDLDPTHHSDGESQLARLAQAGLFKERVKPRSAGRAPGGEALIGLDRQARAYLHANCAHCHQSGGGGGATIDLRYELPLARTGVLDGSPTLGSFGLEDARLIAPGDPYRSVLLYRMAKQGQGHMPHLGSSIVHDEGIRLIHDWIGQMPTEAKRERDVNENEIETTHDAMALLFAKDRSWRSLENDEATRALAERMAEHTNSNVRELFERFLPEERRVRRLGAEFVAEEIVGLQGSPQRGRTLFFREGGSGCATCHQVHGRGRNIGPDLSDVGHRIGRTEIIESIVAPSKTIDPRYVTYAVTTEDELSYLGIMVMKGKESITLKNPLGIETILKREEIVSLTPQGLSSMPEGLLQGMTPQEGADLVAFLVSLVGPNYNP